MTRLLFAFLLFASCWAAVPRAEAKVFDPKTFTLKNGMQVVVIEDPRMPAIVHMVWYKVGSSDEEQGKSGLAHYLEHLMFKGTKAHGPGEFSRLVAVNGGRENAFTNQDYTAYHQTVARDRLELVMRLESDRMTNLVLSPEQAKPELDVVLEERRMRTDNEPSAQLDEQVRAALFLNSRYGVPVIGWEHEIKTLTADDAVAFYRRYYGPNNAILVVAGDVTVAELKPLAEKYYGAIKARPVPPRRDLAEPPAIAARRVTLESAQARRPSLSRSYLAPSVSTATGRDAYALQVLSEILGGGATSRLYRSLVVEQKLASGAGSYYDSGARGMGRFAISAIPREGVAVEVLEKAMDAEIARLLSGGSTAEEVSRARTRLAAQAVFARDSLKAGANALGAALAIGRTVDDVESWPERIQAVVPADVDAAARAFLRPERSVTGVLLPAQGG